MQALTTGAIYLQHTDVDPAAVRAGDEEAVRVDPARLAGALQLHDPARPLHRQVAQAGPEQLRLLTNRESRPIRM